MFKDLNDQTQYIIDNFPEVTDQRIDDNHWDLLCTHCKAIRGFQVTRNEIGNYEVGYKQYQTDFHGPRTFYFRCPVCRAFKMWLVFKLGSHDDPHFFRITSIPSEGLEEIEELPKDPPALRTAYRQAIRAMDANAHLAAAAMFRRAVQIITRDLLKAGPSTLANELHEVIGRTYNGATVTANFADVGYTIKEAGNQGAHPGTRTKRHGRALRYTGFSSGQVSTVSVVGPHSVWLANLKLRNASCRSQAGKAPWLFEIFARREVA